MRSIQEATGTGLLHYLSPGVTTQPTEGVITEDDGTVLNLCIGDDKLSVFAGKRQKRKRGLGRYKNKIPKCKAYTEHELKLTACTYIHTHREILQNEINRS